MGSHLRQGVCCFCEAALNPAAGCVCVCVCVYMCDAQERGDPRDRH